MPENYTIQFHLEGGTSLELEMGENKFSALSQFCDELFPEKEWKTTRKV